SAAHRVGLYVTYYGLSYEKFFAAYTVLFCGVLFVWLLTRMFVQRRSDIVKFLAFLFLWMYGVLTVLPVGQIIVRSNVARAQMPDSQLRLYEMTMLSPDLLGTVTRYKWEGKLAESGAVLARETESSGIAPGAEPSEPDWM